MASFFADKAGRDAGNLFSAMQGQSQNAVQNYLGRGAQAGATETMQDPILGRVYGQGGDYDKLRGNIGTAETEEQGLANRGFSMKPEDYEAYGQASGNIARESGLQEASLAQALANRGIAGSAAATPAFMTQMGNKSERLAQSQRQIANDRMNMNLQRLGQTRNYINQLMGQQQGMTGQALQSEGLKNQQSQNQAELGQRNLAAEQEQANENMAQQAATAQESGFKRLAKAGLVAGGAGAGAAMAGPAGAQSGAAMGSAMGGAF